MVGIDRERKEGSIESEFQIMLSTNENANSHVARKPSLL